MGAGSFYAVASDAGHDMISSLEPDTRRMSVSSTKEREVKLAGKTEEHRQNQFQRLTMDKGRRAECWRMLGVLAWTQGNERGSHRIP